MDATSPSTNAASSRNREVPIRIGARFRWAAIAVAAGWALPLGFAGLVAVSGWQDGDRGLCIAFVAIAALLGWPFLGRVRRAMVRGATMQITADGVQISHPGILREPVLVPRAAIRAVCVDDALDRKDRFPVRRDFRFAAPGDRQETLGFLFAKHDGSQGARRSIFPMLGHDWQRPNFAIVFTSPVRFAPQRSWQRFRSSKPTFGTLREPTIALLAEVADTDGARTVLGGWDVVRGLVEADFAPTPAGDERPAPVAATELEALAARPAKVRVAGSLRRRAALAVGLAFGFYALALSVGLMSLVAAGWILRATLSGGDGPFLVGIGLALAGGCVLWSIVPRRVDETTLGVPVDPASQPRLWATVRRVATSAGERVPDEILLVGELNAHVHETGGRAGRRVLALGLPLLAALTEREAESVIAHELGHFKGGDTRLGRIVASTGRALSRTVHRLDKQAAWWLIPRITRALFAGYLKLYNRLTFEMRRRQEFAADGLAAEIAGVAPAGRALRRIHEADTAFDPYWNTEYAPVLDLGGRPPFAGGFQRFLADRDIAGQMSAIVDRLLIEERQSPTDSHPPLRDRLSAIGAKPMATEADDSGPALALVFAAESIEFKLFVQRFGDEAMDTTRPVPWEHVVEQVQIPSWREHLWALRDPLEGITLGELPAVAASPANLADRLGAEDPREITPEGARAGVIWTLGIGLCVALSDAGFTVSADPGGPVIARRERARLRPFFAIEAMLDGTTDAAAWRARCRAEGIADDPVAPASASSGAESPRLDGPSATNAPAQLV